jgi:hypothetical protein
MPLEVATYVNQLDENWPTGGDKQDRGDDHIRLIKDVMKNTLAGSTGDGWDSPVTVDPAFLNGLAARLTAIEQSIKDQHPIGCLEFRADNVNPGTLYPATVWTLITGDYAIFLGSGANAGTTTGSNSVGVPLPSHNHPVSISDGGNHTHPFGVTRAYDESGGTGLRIGWGQDPSKGKLSGTNSDTNNGGIGAAGVHSHGASSGNTGTPNPTIDVRGARIFLNVWKRVT